MQEYKTYNDIILRPYYQFSTVLFKKTIPVNKLVLINNILQV